MQVKLSELEKEIKPLRELAKIWRGSEIWKVWKEHGMTKQEARKPKAPEIPSLNYAVEDVISWVYQLRVVTAALRDFQHELLADQVERVLREIAGELPLSSIFDRKEDEDG